MCDSSLVAWTFYGPYSSDCLFTFTLFISHLSKDWNPGFSSPLLPSQVSVLTKESTLTLDIVLLSNQSNYSWDMKPGYSFVIAE